MLADMHTPVGIYMKLRDVFYNSILLESSDFRAAENSFSYICCDALAHFTLNNNKVEIEMPAATKEVFDVTQNSLFTLFQQFSDSFVESKGDTGIANGLFGYISSDAISYFDSFSFKETETEIPPIHFTFYRYVIAFNHFKDELIIYENVCEKETPSTDSVISIIRNKNVAEYPFKLDGLEQANMTDDAYKSLVKKAIAHCHRGDVFQLVLSRRFKQKYLGDEMNVYRALRYINPSPYLFYFDYGNFKIFGSSPEAQLVVKGNSAKINPIAGTVKRKGNDELDKQLAQQLNNDIKENSEHVMLVDLARNDLSKHCVDVEVKQYKQTHYYSHVIHLVSEVTGKLSSKHNALQLLADSFPAGTLSGAPKHKAIELIHRYESTQRNFYGGCIGFIGFNGDINTAITIRTFMSKDNTLNYQAGAGIVVVSDPQSEVDEIKNKLGALRKALESAQKLVK